MSQNSVIVINRDGMGSAELELQQKLIKTYLTMIANQNPLPGSICLYAEGVRLAVEGSQVLKELQALEQKGVHIILCSTCLQHYNLCDCVQVGIVGGMHDIIEAQWLADKVITL